MKNSKSTLILSLFLSFLLTGSCHAATATTTFPVTATVLNSCLVAATSLVFGNYNPSLGTALDATNTVTATCTLGSAFNIGLGVGIGSGASVSSRKMTFGGNLLNYTLYSDSSRSTIFGETIGTDTIAITAASLPTTLTVYGRIFGGQNEPAGAYVDTVNVTLTY